MDAQGTGGRLRTTRTRPPGRQGALRHTAVHMTGRLSRTDIDPENRLLSVAPRIQSVTLIMLLPSEPAM